MAEIWKDSPEQHDFPAALDYLALVLEPALAKKAVAALRRATTVRKQAKDLLRASGLPLLPRDNPHVANDLKKIRKGKALSPVLLVRGNAAAGVALTIADGYHRICVSWYQDEDAPVACRIVGLR